MIIGVYAPEEGKLTEEGELYFQVQKIIYSVGKGVDILIMGDFNARVGSQPIEGVVGTFGEDTCNRNGELLREFATFNQLKITNTFFQKKDIHKYTWAARETRSLIDYVVVNRR